MSTADIDRLAKAAADELGGRLTMDASDEGESAKVWLEDGYYDFHAIVRAVLQALREPGLDAQKAALDDIFDAETYTTLYRDDCETGGLPFFTAMIDKLLEE